MTNEERIELTAIIREQIEKLEGKIEELKEFTEPISPDDSIGRISRMDAINNKSVFDASMRNTRERVLQLQNILTQKDDPDFGRCLKCHQVIPLGRLKIRPEIRECADCLRVG